MLKGEHFVPQSIGRHPFGGCCGASATTLTLLCSPWIPWAAPSGGGMNGIRTRPCDLHTQDGFGLAAQPSSFPLPCNPSHLPGLGASSAEPRGGTVLPGAFVQRVIHCFQRWKNGHFCMVHFHKAGSACKSISLEHAVNGLWSVRGLYCWKSPAVRNAASRGQSLWPRVSSSHGRRSQLPCLDANPSASSPKPLGTLRDHMWSVCLEIELCLEEK